MPAWTLGLGGMLAFLSDKVSALSKSRTEGWAIGVCDRFITTQAILGLQAIEDPAEQQVGETIIWQLHQWAYTAFATDSVLVFLDAQFETLFSRLEEHIGRPLQQAQCKAFVREVQAYRDISQLDFAWDCIRLTADDPTSELAYRLESSLIERWALP